MLHNPGRGKVLNIKIKYMCQTKTMAHKLLYIIINEIKYKTNHKEVRDMFA